MKTKHFGLPAIVVALFLLGGCAFAAPASGSVSPALTSSPAPASQTAGAEWALAVDTVTLDGAPVTSADFAGNTLTVLNVWATWCPPCVAELPHLQAMSETFADQGVEIVGVLEDGVTELGVPDEATIDNAKTLLADAGAGYRVILPDEALRETFISEMQYFPTTFFLDSSGNLVETVVGANSAQDWEDIIHGVLQKVS